MPAETGSGPRPVPHPGAKDQYPPTATRTHPSPSATVGTRIPAPPAAATRSADSPTRSRPPAAEPHRPLRDPHPRPEWCRSWSRGRRPRPAVRADGDRAVQTGDVGVVQGHVGVGGAAHGDPAAVQQMHPRPRPARRPRAAGSARRPARGAARGPRGAQGQHGAVDQRRLTEGAAAGVEPLGARVQHHGAPPASRPAPPSPVTAPASADATAASSVPAGAVTSTIAARGAAPLRGRAERVYDGQPDLHPHPNTSTSASTSRKASSHLPRTARREPGDK